MIPVNITLTFVRGNSKESRRIKLSLTDQVDDVIDQLVGELGLPAPESSGGQYVLIHNKQALDGQDTLQMSGIQEGDIVQLTFMDKNATMGQAVSMALLNRMGGKASHDPLPVAAALFSADGHRFDLRHTRALIGRSDPKLGYPPESLDADLTSLDPGKSISRPHALIVYADGRFTIRDLYSQTGLQLNGESVSSSRSVPLQDGDILKLGDVEVQFRCET